MTRILLARGMLVGVVPGLLVIALARWVGEPQVERAIAFETKMDRAMGGASEPKVVSREVQRIFVIVTAHISHFLPEFDEVPAGFPLTLTWKFRAAAIEMQVLMWSVLGFPFGWFADRDLAAQQLHS